MSDDEVVMVSKNFFRTVPTRDQLFSRTFLLQLLDEISSDCGSSTSSVDATMDQLLDDLDSYNPLDTGRSVIRARVNSLVQFSDRASDRTV